MNKYCKSDKATPVKMADGGSVGLFERLKAGNIDDPKSEAYKRWGAGSKSEPVTKSESAAPSEPAKGMSESERTRMMEANTNDAQSDTSEADAETARESRRSSPTNAPSKPAVKATPKKATAKAPSRPAAASMNRQAVTGGGYGGGAAAASAKTTSAELRAQPQSVKDKRHEAEMADAPLGRGVKSVGNYLSKAFSLGPDFNKPSRPTIYASDKERAQYSAGRAEGVKGMANGGVVGGSAGGAKSYGKK